MTIEEVKEKAYQSMNNYKVVDYPNNKSNLCYIFCSSNGIYSGKTEQQQIDFINNDKYEWENLSKTKEISKTAKRIIYLRDIYCHSYVDGINSDINCIDKIIELCKELTKGYQIVCLGFSAGGYLSMILGSFLPNVKKVYSFAGLFSLYKWTGAKDEYTFSDVKAYTNHETDALYSKYYDIKEYVESSNTEIYHFYSSKCKSDLVQLDHIDSSKVYCFGFGSSAHGKTLNSYDIPQLIIISDKKNKKIIDKYNGKNNIDKNSFSVYSFGLIHFILENIKRIIRRIKRRK